MVQYGRGVRSPNPDLLLYTVGGIAGWGTEGRVEEGEASRRG